MLRKTYRNIRATRIKIGTKEATAVRLDLRQERLSDIFTANVTKIRGHTIKGMKKPVTKKITSGTTKPAVSSPNSRRSIRITTKVGRRLRPNRDDPSEKVPIPPIFRPKKCVKTDTPNHKNKRTGVTKANRDITPKGSPRGKMEYSHLVGVKLTSENIAIRIIQITDTRTTEINE